MSLNQQGFVLFVFVCLFVFLFDTTLTVHYYYPLLSSDEGKSKLYAFLKLVLCICASNAYFVFIVQTVFDCFAKK